MIVHLYVRGEPAPVDITPMCRSEAHAAAAAAACTWLECSTLAENMQRHPTPAWHVH
jgi:hypothetical protein